MLTVSNLQGMEEKEKAIQVKRELPQEESTRDTSLPAKKPRLDQIFPIALSSTLKQLDNLLRANRFFRLSEFC